MRKFMFGLLVAISLLAGGSACANYVCTYQHVPSSTTFGNYGYTSSTFYTGPHCTGSFVSSAYFCSTGATNAYCATAATCGGTSYLSSEAGLHWLAEMLQQAEINGSTANLVVCTGPAGAWVTFSE